MPFERTAAKLGRFLEANAHPPLHGPEKYPQYTWGRGTYGRIEVRGEGEGATLKVGNFCSLAPGVMIYLGSEHRSDWVTTFPFPVFWPEAERFTEYSRSRGDVTIGNDVWIGESALILSGVTIGDGAIVGAGAVVRKDIPPYAIAIGNPAQIVKYRFDPNIVAELLAIQWWNWPDDKIRRALPSLLSPNISAFIQSSRDGQFDE